MLKILSMGFPPFLPDSVMGKGEKTQAKLHPNPHKPELLQLELG